LLVDIYDPHANHEEVKHEYGLSLLPTLSSSYHAIILAVGHDEFRTIDWKIIRNSSTIVYDVKGFLDRSLISARL